MDLLMPLAKQGNMNVSAWLDEMLEHYEQRPDSEGEQDLILFCESFIGPLEHPAPQGNDHSGRPEITDDHIGLVVKAAASLKRLDFLERVAKLVRSHLPIARFFNIGTLLRHVKLSDCKPA